MKKIKKIILLIAGILILAGILFAAEYFLAGGNGRKAELSFQSRKLLILAELAISPQEHQRGLMYREKMGVDEGMLFVFGDEEKRDFWMKNTKIPLDMIFISSDKKIVDIKNSFEPCAVEMCPGYESIAPARYVLEVNSGLAQRNGLKIGDKVGIKIK